jgi:hypothetical protein
LSASLLGDDLDRRREELHAALPIRHVVGPSDIAALAVHIMSNTALTGAIYDIDGGSSWWRGDMRDATEGRCAVTRSPPPAGSCR